MSYHQPISVTENLISAEGVLCSAGRDRRHLCTVPDCPCGGRLYADHIPWEDFLELERQTREDEGAGLGLFPLMAAPVGAVLWGLLIYWLL